MLGPPPLHPMGFGPVLPCGADLLTDPIDDDGSDAVLWVHELPVAAKNLSRLGTDIADPEHLFTPYDESLEELPECPQSLFEVGVRGTEQMESLVEEAVVSRDMEADFFLRSFGLSPDFETARISEDLVEFEPLLLCEHGVLLVS